MEEDQDESSQVNILNLFTHIISIRDFIASNINLSNSVSNNSVSLNTSSSPTDAAILNSSSSHDSDSEIYDQNAQPDLLTHILDKLNEIELLLFEEKTNNINKLKCLQAEINKINIKNKNLTEDFDYLNDQLYDIDVRLIDSEQYPRRHNLIISGIPNSVNQMNLEKTAINIISSIGFNISSYEVVGCHRLHNNHNSTFPAKTIIRFTNRKVVEYCIRNRDKLLELKKTLRMNLRFYENLCDNNERVFNWCRELNKHEKLHEYYVRNGFVKIIINKGDRPIKIRHPDQLFHYFQEYFDYIDLYEL